MPYYNHKMTHNTSKEIYAEISYFVILGLKKDIENIAINHDELIAVPTKDTLSKTILKIEKTQKIELDVAESIETIQCNILANKSDGKSDLYMLMSIIDNTISFPVFDLAEGDEPKKIVSDGIISMYNVKLSKLTKKLIRPLAIVGANNDILVMITNIITIDL